MRAHLCALFVTALVVGALPTYASSHLSPVPQPSPIAAVIQVTVIPATRAASVVRQLYPKLHVQVDAHANAIVVMGSPDDVQESRAVVSGIDVKDPTRATVEVVQLHIAKPTDLVGRIAPLFPDAKLSVASRTSLMLRATALDNAEIKALINSLDVPPASAPPSTPSPVEAVQVKVAQPRNVARALSREVPHVQVSVSGSSVLLRGDTQSVQIAKALVSQLDTPPFGARYTEIYRLKNVDATSVGDLVQRTFPNATVTIDKDLNAISVLGTASEQDRISGAIGQLDGAQGENAGPNSGAGAAYGLSNIEVVHIRSAIPGQNNGATTTPQDIATAVTQSLSQMASNLHITVPNNSDEIVLAGDPTSIRLAKELIEKLDVAPPLVELDTEVLELDETAVRNVGLELPGAVLTTTYSEVLPTPDANGNPGRIMKIQPITRTALALTAQLNLLIQNGDGRVLADPRIATLSGHTASIRAGDTLAILTTTGGGVGTPVTQQLQTFNTGVTLDITPQVSDKNDVIVALHPVVNSLSGILNGVPQIATRDTQTVVHLQNNQTVVIGGLIQEADTRTMSSIPILGQLPLVGGLFRNKDTNVTRNELVIVVTPHVLKGGESPPPPNATMGLPTAAPLPTVPPMAALPPVSATSKVTPAPASTPVLATAIPTPTFQPLPTPSGFAATNVFEYGIVPQNNHAATTDPSQIFYARLTPTLLTPTSSIAIDVVTTTNVTQVTIGAAGRTTTLNNVGTGKWNLTFPASQLGLSSAQQTTMLTLSASKNGGTTGATIQIPVSLMAH